MTDAFEKELEDMLMGANYSASNYGLGVPRSLQRECHVLSVVLAKYRAFKAEQKGIWCSVNDMPCDHTAYTYEVYDAQEYQRSFYTYFKEGYILKIRWNKIDADFMSATDNVTTKLERKVGIYQRLERKNA